VSDPSFARSSNGGLNSAFAVLVYLLALTLSAILHHEDGVAVWHTGVRFFPWYATRASLNSAPASPSKQWKKPLQLAEAPQRPLRQATYPQSYSLEKDIKARHEPTYEPSRPAPFVPVSDMVRPSVEPASLYPATLKSSLPPIARAPRPLGSTPAPLGDWPRRQPEPTHRQLSISNVTPASTTVPVGSSAARPRHPRNGSSGSLGRQRPIPPPLDLTRISAYRQIEDRMARG
jgi:hypothetical protein